MVTAMTKSNDKTVQDTAWNAALYFDFPSLIQQALKDAVNPNVSKDRRILAIGALRGGHFKTVALNTRSCYRVAATTRCRNRQRGCPGVVWRPGGRRNSIAPMVNFDARWGAACAGGACRAAESSTLLLKAIEDGQVKPSALDPSVRSRLFENPNAAVVEESRKLRRAPTRIAQN